MRRAAVSIPSNIAEGRSRDSRREFLYFLSVSRGSLAELETQLELAIRLDYTDSDLHAARAQTDMLGKKLNRLQTSLRARLPTPNPQSRPRIPNP
jgi:four helix bundle protein